MDVEKIKKYIKNGKTLLGIGPMSVNTVDASVEIANDYDVPVMLIASRRQIDTKNIKCGYVNNWSTEDFAKYVRDKQKKDNIILARDHGGPWQNNIETEKKFSLKEAMNSAKMSYQQDIEAGFDILHIDPSIDIYNQISFEQIFERLCELYDFCNSYAVLKNKNIEYEIGTEEQMIHINSVFEFTKMLNKIGEFCFENDFKYPLFVVSQIGTKVMETRNIGLLNQENNEKLIDEIKELCIATENKNIFIKVHNTDYLKPEILSKFPMMKINAANVAPEFGVCETRAFLDILGQHHLYSYRNEFLEMAYNSKKWSKWIVAGYLISDKEKSVIAGHYVFADERFIILKEKAQKQIKDMNIDEYLKKSVKLSILQYMLYFNMIKAEDIKNNDKKD